MRHISPQENETLIIDHSPTDSGTMICSTIGMHPDRKGLARDLDDSRHGVFPLVVFIGGPSPT